MGDQYRCHTKVSHHRPVSTDSPVEVVARPQSVHPLYATDSAAITMMRTAPDQCPIATLASRNGLLLVLLHAE